MDLEQRVKIKRGCLISSSTAVIELVEMTICTIYGGFDRLNHHTNFFLDSPTPLPKKAYFPGMKPGIFFNSKIGYWHQISAIRKHSRTFENNYFVSATQTPFQFSGGFLISFLHLSIYFLAGISNLSILEKKTIASLKLPS